jgi:predicted PurR-regulated permease PerM
MLIKEYPFYLKATVIMFGLILACYILNQLGDILVPFCFAGLFAVLLNPLCTRLEMLRLPRIAAILLTILIAIAIVVAIFYFLSSQIISFTASFPALKDKFGQMMTQLEGWVYNHFGIATQKQVQFIRDTMSNSRALVGRTVNTVIGTLSIIFLIPVYVFMMLFYKTLILNFLYEVFSEEHSQQVAEILRETKGAIQSYIVGLLVEMIIVAVLNSLALIILDVKYAVLLGVIGAILNILPYIGGIIAIALPILMATVTKDGFSTQIGIFVAYIIIQFIDNNFIYPRFVSFRVQINALISIVIVLMGNGLWGVSGMFLSVPFIAVLKIIFDRIDELKPWGKLLGDQVPTRHMGQIWRRRRRKKLGEENDGENGNPEV